MTEVASGVPGQRSDSDEPVSSGFGAAADSDSSSGFGAAADTSSGFGAAAESGSGFGPAEEESVVTQTAMSTVDSADDPPSALERVQDVAERAQERAGEVAERVQERAGEVAERVSDAMERAAQASGRVAAAVVDRLRNSAELTAERGRTTIANEVVEKIAGIAAREVPGVYDLGGDVARVFAAVREKIGLGEDRGDAADRGVSVRLEGGRAAVEVTIVIEYGFVVYSVTEKVRAKVISSVENLLGLEVTEVNITVDDVHVEDAGPVGNDQARAAGYQ
ncbi:MAG TPA: Asp23/Gls24 family envelope stress response protein [Micromonosporaceae bacterium]|jgi:uncharacterized alkaline shock family protein YloU|nr:Asp23/Gls24 family envelope stress response protein [Micromonosporaceae bacterium]